MRYLFFLLLLSIEITAQPTFNYRYSLGFTASGFSSVVPVDSGYYITGLGVRNNPYSGIVRSVFAFADTLGQVLWQKEIIGEGGVHIGAYLGTLQRKNDSSFITVGVQFGDGCDKSCLFNYNAQGDTVWVTKFPSMLDSCSFMRGDGLCFTNDGGFLMGTSAQPYDTWDSKIVVSKADSIGNILWHRVYGSTSLYYREEWPVLKNIDGQTVMAARHWKWIWATTSNYDMQHQFWWLDSVGNVTQTYTTPTIKPGTVNTPWLLTPPADFIQSKDKGWVVATGFGTEIQTAPPNPVQKQPYIYKLDSALNFVWDITIEGYYPQQDINAVKIIELEDSSLMVAGTLFDYIVPGDTTPPTCYQGFISKISREGQKLWSRNYYGICTFLDGNRVYDFKRCPDGGYILCGQSQAGTGSQPLQQGWLLKLDSMGCLIPGCHITAIAQTEGNVAVPIKVFPNPATDFINLYIPAVGKLVDTDGSGLVDTDGRPYQPNHPKTPFHLHLYDINGHLLQNHALPQSDATYMLTTEGLESGVYILQLLDDGGRIIGTEKVVVKK